MFQISIAHFLNGIKLQDFLKIQVFSFIYFELKYCKKEVDL